MKAKATNTPFKNVLLTECAWEVCNQIGGIYTVIRSKAPAVSEVWKDNYCAIGPYFPATAEIEFEPAKNFDCPFGQAVSRMRERGFEVHFGTWMVSGRPKVILIDPFSAFAHLLDIKSTLYARHHIQSEHADDLQHQVLAFSLVVKEFYRDLCCVTEKKILGHFHEWMAGTAIPDIRYEQIPVTCIFTTHATLLGRYLAMNDNQFYKQLPVYDWETEAVNFDIDLPVRLERAAAHGSHIFTTISEVTARECEYLLGRRPQHILPNGLNIDRFSADHYHQILHGEVKDQIHEFVMGHFFQSYSFDLDNTLYFFTSGRFEYFNKGFDVCVEALARLNYMLQKSGSKKTIVMFFITRRPFYSINSEVLHSRAMMEEMREIIEAIQNQIGKSLFKAIAGMRDLKLPHLNDFVDDYWKLRMRRHLQAWKRKELPLIVTHDLQDQNDELLNAFRRTLLLNNEHDRVKVVYHPDFLQSTNPLFGVDYTQFIRGCHLGIFPSFYEPWGYTPLECLASGVPSITSDFTGFAQYALKNIKTPHKKGMYVIQRRHKDFHAISQQLAEAMFQFANQTRRERINQRNRTEGSSENFDWKVLLKYYSEAYISALKM